MKNIKSFFIADNMGSSGIICENKEDFLLYLSEEIDRIDEEGQFEYFDIMIDLNNG